MPADLQWIFHHLINAMNKGLTCEWESSLEDCVGTGVAVGPWDRKYRNVDSIRTNRLHKPPKLAHLG